MKSKDSCRFLIVVSCGCLNVRLEQPKQALRIIFEPTLRYEAPQADEHGDEPHGLDLDQDE